MNTRKRHYVGCKAGTRTVFSCVGWATENTHGHMFNAVIGPFRTKRGATFMAEHGANNPHCITVSDAERLAKIAWALNVYAQARVSFVMTNDDMLDAAIL